MTIASLIIQCTYHNDISFIREPLILELLEILSSYSAQFIFIYSFDPRPMISVYALSVIQELPFKAPLVCGFNPHCLPGIQLRITDNLAIRDVRDRGCLGGL